MLPRKILLDVLGTLFQAKPIRPKTARRDPPSRLTLDRAPNREREDSLRAEKQALGSRSPAKLSATLSE